jgi:hypothetical protein
MLDAWWKTLSVRLDSGPAALHRLPETVAHIAEDTAVTDEERVRFQIKPRTRLMAEPDQPARWPPQVPETPKILQPASKHE